MWYAEMTEYFLLVGDRANANDNVISLQFLEILKPVLTDAEGACDKGLARRVYIGNLMAGFQVVDAEHIIVSEAAIAAINAGRPINVVSRKKKSRK